MAPSLHRNPRATVATNDPAYVALVDAENKRQARLRFPCRIPAAKIANVFCRKAMRVVRFATRFFQFPTPMQHVLRIGAPFQVVGSVVASVSVLVVDLGVLERIRYERLSYQPMHEERMLPLRARAESYSVVGLSFGAEAFWRDEVPVSPVTRLDRAVSPDPIQRKPWDRKVVSHTWKYDTSLSHFNPFGS